MYNPSKKVTDILGKFLEFDPEELEVGIWSGDIALKNVNLRKDALHPLLNKKLYKEAAAQAAAAAAAAAAMASTEEGDTSSSYSYSLNQPQHKMNLKQPPLAMKLVSGTVGHMRIQIPWKRLVWGQGAVNLEISDVMIVLSLQSRDETIKEQERIRIEQQEKLLRKRQKQQQDGSNDGDSSDNQQKDKNNSSSSIYSKAYRDAKQRRLREAEKRQLSGQPITNWLDALHRKNAITKEAKKVEQNALKATALGGGKGHYHPDDKQERKEGRFDKFLKSFSSDLFWRFFAGVQGSIKKARIVIVQDGVEVGCIVQSIEVIAGQDGARINFNIDEDVASHHNTATESTGKNSASNRQVRSTMTPPHTSVAGGSQQNPQPPPFDEDESPHPAHYESAYDDGEHVDKTLKQQGLGIFVRKEANMAKVPKQIRFSTSVSADDYILRPVNLDLSFSFFYPYPPERRKTIQRPAVVDSKSEGTPTTTTNTTANNNNNNKDMSIRLILLFLKVVLRPIPKDGGGNETKIQRHHRTMI